MSPAALRAAVVAADFEQAAHLVTLVRAQIEHTHEALNAQVAPVPVS